VNEINTGAELEATGSNSSLPADASEEHSIDLKQNDPVLQELKERRAQRVEAKRLQARIMKTLRSMFSTWVSAAGEAAAQQQKDEIEFPELPDVEDFEDVENQVVETEPEAAPVDLGDDIESIGPNTTTFAKFAAYCDGLIDEPALVEAVIELNPVARAVIAEVVVAEEVSDCDVEKEGASAQTSESCKPEVAAIQLLTEVGVNSEVPWELISEQESEGSEHTGDWELRSDGSWDEFAATAPVPDKQNDRADGQDCNGIQVLYELAAARKLLAAEMANNRALEVQLEQQQQHAVAEQARLEAELRALRTLAPMNTPRTPRHPSPLSEKKKQQREHAQKQQRERCLSREQSQQAEHQKMGVASHLEQQKRERQRLEEKQQERMETHHLEHQQEMEKQRLEEEMGSQRLVQQQRDIEKQRMAEVAKERQRLVQQQRNIEKQRLEEERAEQHKRAEHQQRLEQEHLHRKMEYEKMQQQKEQRHAAQVEKRRVEQEAIEVRRAEQQQMEQKEQQDRLEHQLTRQMEHQHRHRRRSQSSAAASVAPNLQHESPQTPPRSGSPSFSRPPGTLERPAVDAGLCQRIGSSSPFRSRFALVVAGPESMRHCGLFGGPSVDHLIPNGLHAQEPSTCLQCAGPVNEYSAPVDGRLVCDMCDHELPVGACVLSCLECDYDVCGQCRQCPRVPVQPPRGPVPSTWSIHTPIMTDMWNGPHRHLPGVGMRARSPLLIS
jgi:hypothetical protein